MYHSVFNYGLSFETSELMVDADWDDFVAAAPGGCHMQACFWAAFKAEAGWRPLRVIIRKDGEIVAGAQMLMRNLGNVFNVAAAFQGPILREGILGAQESLVGALLELVHSHHIQYLVVEQARWNVPSVEFRKWGFQNGYILSDRRATVILDLTVGPASCLLRMKRTTRNNVRIAESMGVHVREGDADDIPRFCQLLELTGQRRHFFPESLDYYLAMWHHLAPLNRVKLFLSERNHVLISGLLTIPFGDTVVGKRFAWSGEQKWARPNELLYWKAIEWAIKHGYSRFDFDGIDFSAAEALYNSLALPKSAVSSPTRFKLGFGGRIVFLPRSLEYVRSRSLRVLLRSVAGILGRSRLRDALYRTILRR